MNEENEMKKENENAAADGMNEENAAVTDEMKEANEAVTERSTKDVIVESIKKAAKKVKDFVTNLFHRDGNQEEEEKQEADANDDQLKAHLIVFEVRDDNARDYGYALIDEIMAIKGFKDALYEKELKIEDCNKMNKAKINFVIEQYYANEKVEDNGLVKIVRKRLEQDEKVKKIKMMEIPYFLS